MSNVHTPARSDGDRFDAIEAQLDRLVEKLERVLADPAAIERLRAQLSETGHINERLDVVDAALVQRQQELGL